MAVLSKVSNQGIRTFIIRFVERYEPVPLNYLIKLLGPDIEQSKKYLEELEENKLIIVADGKVELASRRSRR